MSAPVDQAKNAEKFLADTVHEQRLDKLLWAMRMRRDAAARQVPEWEDLRTLASEIKEHTLSNLSDYLIQFEAKATANGVIVHWARDAHEHNQTVYDLLSEQRAETLVKSKSMLTEECELRPFLERRGVRVTETDLGERIQQLDDQPPGHIVGPAIHKTTHDVAVLFSEKYGSDPNNDDPAYLAGVMRENTRPDLLNAPAGMTGANFVVAETGAIVVATNEGNADLSAHTPPLHICSVGIEKIIPTTESLAVFIRLLARSATGEAITQYTSMFRGPRKGAAMHVILVDNGRSERLGMKRFWHSLKCIRCAACMNTCPVYRRSGGLSYGSTYMGPIGIIMMPTFEIRKYSELPFASTLNGSCTNVCPVKIDIHEQIYGWREVMEENGQTPIVKKEAMRVADEMLSHPALYQMATAAVSTALEVLPHFAIYNRLNVWGKHRDVPQAGAETFHAWYKAHRPKANEEVKS
ncbi:MAG TPA: lactate utilization protein B [Alloacidobacterium sp.]|jgi:L-lactate dehydrogenase complex protein LldF|nr:lactate utilization protein B [Alloacidobacterium sp.]